MDLKIGITEEVYECCVQSVCGTGYVREEECDGVGEQVPEGRCAENSVMKSFTDCTLVFITKGRRVGWAGHVTRIGLQ